MADGVAGKELGASIKSIKPSQWQKGSTDIELKLATGSATVKEVEVRAAAGQPLEANVSGRMQMNTQTTLTISVKGNVPATGKIMVELFDGWKKFDAPFSLKNISLLGQPVK